jgi:hypothetical protein
LKSCRITAHSFRAQEGVPDHRPILVTFKEFPTNRRTGTFGRESGEHRLDGRGY